ncbi:hypothetical protein AB0N38_18690 [Micromonospora aurantiaca]|uniref:Uncharacterized protein n=1 Tax=Micromonospora aurantiaca (nom. illeg.) TaxID=47850 RepID=A0ABQ6UFP2_9ACTN|nr:hypothetical protein [Micromonospora aurantiaca]KAB1111990.1 hypothetical protein F6X54_16070 [Micromonospora aurantiaca]
MASKMAVVRRPTRSTTRRIAFLPLCDQEVLMLSKLIDTWNLFYSMVIPATSKKAQAGRTRTKCT